MLDKIILKKAATFNDEGGVLENLKKINFIYGNNGSGKTTISELLRNESGFPYCSLEWKSRKVATYVYNRNFVIENFHQDETIKGIFTLGKESINLQAKIELLKEEINRNTESLGKLDGVYLHKIKEQKDLIDEFKELCWEIKKEVDEDFKDLIEGYRNSKESFMNKCIEETKNINRKLKTIEDIKLKKESFFDRIIEKLEVYSILKFEAIEDIYIFQKKIIGKEDVDIADLIMKLNISDWVKQGFTYIKKSEEQCPFCQQELPEEFENKLISYFDQTYLGNIELLNNVSTNYENQTIEIISEIELLIKNSKGLYLNEKKVEEFLILIKSKFKENIQLIDNKKKEPSSTIELSETSTLINKVNLELLKANKEIIKYNDLIENFKAEKENLIKDMWRYIVEKNKRTFTSFNIKKINVEKAIIGINDNREKKKIIIRDIGRKVTSLQEHTTSIEYSVSEINKTLESFGFINFKLSTAEKKGNYKIIRDNGDDAKETLSEGEKTFITFLYFYQLLKGSASIENIITEKVVVIDDPISSLDSNVLFMVSSLVRQIMFDIKENKMDIKQLFILTHNIYFHKEVTFKQGKKNYGEAGFWIVKKKDNQSVIVQYDENPIKTSYELLWKELKSRDKQSLASIQNVMRRILENYFKFLGNIALDSLEDSFEYEDKLRCRSLISWINDGSHFISDDLFVESSEDVVERFFEVFRKIFDSQGHIAHFNMMMSSFSEKPITIENEDTDNFNEGNDEIRASFKEVAVTRQ
ncbi:AAA family ATPase [Sporosarcina sp. CAU 1771]